MEKKNLRILGVTVAFAAVSTALFTTQYSGSTAEPQYQPRAEIDNGAAGYIEYLNSIRANVHTGQIEFEDVLKARKELSSKIAAKTNSSLNLEWQELGPDNFGGRTRAILVDKDNSNKVFAASVSGGLFVSNNAGATWTPVDDHMDNLAVVSIAQSTNGDIYIGTGEGMYYSTSGVGTGGIAGGGMFKSTDGGVTFTKLPNTDPGNVGSGWANIGKIFCDPNNPNRVYACTNGGFQMSEDGGSTWANPISGASGQATDMDLAPNGNVWVSVGSRLYYSPNGDVGSYDEKTSQTGGPQTLPRNNLRMRPAVNHSDPDYVYIIQVGAGEAMRGVYRSTDRGETWTLIGQNTPNFDPLCNASQCQGTFDLLIFTPPSNPDLVFIGGVMLWKWSPTLGWTPVNSSFRTPGNPYYIHVDFHAMVYDPKDPDIIYVGCDGGVFKSLDAGITWKEMNRNYSTIQFYDVAVGMDHTVLGGTQDNSNFIIDGTGNSPRSAQQLFGGDGAYAAISWLDPNFLLVESQYGNMVRHRPPIVNFQRFFSPQMTQIGAPGTSNFGAFVTPFYLYENPNDSLSVDSITFINSGASQSLGFGNGIQKEFSNTLPRPQPSAEFVASTFKVVAGAFELESDANGNITGDGTGTFDDSTGAYTIEFNTPPFGEIIITCNTVYPAGAGLSLASKIQQYPVPHTLDAPLMMNDTLKVQDPFQAALFFGGKHSGSASLGSPGGLWMTRQVLDVNNPSPRWFKLAHFGTAEPRCMDMSDDGDVLFVGTADGRVFRITGINRARTEETVSGSLSTIESVMIGNFNRAVNSVAVDPNDANRVIVTLGNYGSTNYIRFSTNALSPSPTFLSKQGDLANIPVYASVFDKNNPAFVVIGTDYGVFSTTNINAGSPTWTQDNDGLANTPVFRLVQYRQWYDSPENGTPIVDGHLFAATHGRGFFRTGTLSQQRPVSVEENKLPTIEARESLKIFPNPAREYTQIAVELGTVSDVSVNIRNIEGKLMKSQNFRRLPAGTSNLELDLAELKGGLYLITVNYGSTSKTGKLVVAK